MRISLLWERVTASRITIIYFTFASLHCLVQTIFQIQAFRINDQAVIHIADFLSSHGGSVNKRGFAIMDQDKLRWCRSIPQGTNADGCTVLWPKEESQNASTASAASRSEVLTSTDILVQAFTSIETNSVAATSPIPTTSSSARVAFTTSSSTSSPTSIPLLESTSASLALTSTSIRTSTIQPTSSRTSNSAAATSLSTPGNNAFPGSISNLSDDDDNNNDRAANSRRRDLTDQRSSIFLEYSPSSSQLINRDVPEQGTPEEQCLTALNWPLQKLKNTKREDIAFIGFQFWLFGMSLVAILNESVPHMIAAVATHIFTAAWGIFQIVHTIHFKNDFDNLIVQGVCASQSQPDMLSEYWQARNNSEIPSLSLNLVAMFASMYLTFRIIKLFGWMTYKHLGSNLKIRKIYFQVLNFSILLQLGLFFIMCGLGLWIDQLWNGPIAKLARHSQLYKTFATIIASILIPWLIAGWYAVRKELRLVMMIFIFLTFCYVGGFGAMFASPTFRWTFVSWAFFAISETIAAALALAIMILGIICRLNFGKGLLETLQSPEELTDKVEYEGSSQSPTIGEVMDDDKADPYSPSEFEEIPVEPLDKHAPLNRQDSTGSQRSDRSSHISRSDSQASRSGSIKVKRWAIED